MEKNGKSKKQEIMEERLQNTARITEELEAQGYHTENATLSVMKANMLALVTALPFSAVFIGILLLYCPLDRFAELLFSLKSGILLTVLMLLSIPVHEGLHGLGWVFFCEERLKSIQFGVMWDKLTPYCHCREALTIKHYACGLLLPFTILGILPCLLALILVSPFWMVFGAYNILLAGGDTTIAFLLAKYAGKGVKILDHPSECGAVVFVRQCSFAAAFAA